MKNSLLLLAAFMFGLQAVPAGALDAAAVFKTKCVTCHGKDRKGNPAMAKMFKVEPAALDLTGKAALSRSDADLAKIISEGKGKMPPNKDKLTGGEIGELVAYLKGAPAGVTDEKRNAPAGNAVYKANCVTCHGKDGKGNPAMAKMLRVSLEDLDFFPHMDRHSDTDYIRKISKGDGEMPAFKGRLTAAEIVDLVAYIHTLLAPAPKPAAPEGNKK